MTTQQNIDELKAKYQTQMENVAQEIRDHINEYSNKPCDYLIVRQHRETYYRGSYNALIELEKL